jgi:hypothetical protein
MSDGSGEWFDGVSVSNDGDASLPMGWVHPNGARTGRSGHGRSRWGRTRRVPDVGQQWARGLW